MLVVSTALLHGMPQAQTLFTGYIEVSQTIFPISYSQWLRVPYDHRAVLGTCKIEKQHRANTVILQDWLQFVVYYHHQFKLKQRQPKPVGEPLAQGQQISFPSYLVFTFRCVILWLPDNPCTLKVEPYACTRACVAVRFPGMRGLFTSLRRCLSTNFFVILVRCLDRNVVLNGKSRIFTMDARLFSCFCLDRNAALHGKSRI